MDQQDVKTYTDITGEGTPLDDQSPRKTRTLKPYTVRKSIGKPGKGPGRPKKVVQALGKPPEGSPKGPDAAEIPAPENKTDEDMLKEEKQRF